MTPENLNNDQRQKVEDFKKFPRKMGRAPKEFGPLLKAAAFVLRDAGLTIKEIAEELKVHPETAAKIFRDKEVKLDTKDVEKIRENFSNNIAEIVNKMLVAANTNEYVYNLAKSKSPGLIEALTKLIEKHQLLQNKPSAIMEVRDTAKLIIDKMKELEDMEQALKQSIIIPENPKGN